MQIFKTQTTGTICIKHRRWFYMTIYGETNIIEISLRLFKFYKVLNFKGDTYVR